MRELSLSSFGTVFLLLRSAIVFGAEPPVPRFDAVEIDSKVEIGYGLAVVDIDGDGKLDIVLVDRHQIAWYQNPGWAKHVIAENLTERDHVCIAARDIDGDGKAEIAIGAQWNPGDTVGSGAVFYLIPPEDRTQKWEPAQLQHEPTTHRMHWVRDREGKYDLVVLPLHGRGNRGGAGDGVKVLAYRMPPNPKDPWKTELIDESMHMTHNFEIVEWANGADEEMLAGGKEGVLHLVRQRDGWGRSQLAGNKAGETSFPGVGEVRAGNLGSGHRFFATIEPMHGNSLVFYTQPASGGGESFWSRHVLDDSLVDGHALACGDFIGLGRDQIVVGWRAMNSRNAKVGIKILTPLDATGSQWRTTLVDDNTMACEDLKVADLNGDGRLDIVGAGRATKNLKIYWNVSKR
ncbi:MAG: FG-GAP and VCBS repeat-containing protein [Verrucomicrobia bacterium]|nr:FG-GAP and VCBS repeat-containing protein [Verrucomicrobiota bacterium]